MARISPEDQILKLREHTYYLAEDKVILFITVEQLLMLVEEGACELADQLPGEISPVVFAIGNNGPLNNVSYGALSLQPYTSDNPELKDVRPMRGFISNGYGRVVADLKPKDYVAVPVKQTKKSTDATH